MIIKLSSTRQALLETPDGDIPLFEFMIIERRKAGITCNQLAYRAGLDHATLQRIEMGKNDSLKAMIDALGALGFKTSIVADNDRNGD